MTADINDKKKTEKEEADQNNAGAENDVVLEETNEDGESFADDKIKKLRDELAVCNRQKQEYLDGWQRERANFANAHREMEREKQEFVKFAAERVLMEILPALDSFDMAFANTAAWEATPKEWRVGIEHIYAQLLSALDTHDLKQINPVGEKFNPAEHVSVLSVKTERQEEDHKIMEVLQKGYKLHNRVIRPARVKIAEIVMSNA